MDDVKMTMMLNDKQLTLKMGKIYFKSFDTFHAGSGFSSTKSDLLIINHRKLLPLHSLSVKTFQ